MLYVNGVIWICLWKFKTWCWKKVQWDCTSTIEPQGFLRWHKGQCSPSWGCLVFKQLLMIRWHRFGRKWLSTICKYELTINDERYCKPFNLFGHVDHVLIVNAAAWLEDIWCYSFKCMWHVSHFAFWQQDYIRWLWRFMFCNIGLPSWRRSFQ